MWKKKKTNILLGLGAAPPPPIPCERRRGRGSSTGCLSLGRLLLLLLCFFTILVSCGSVLFCRWVHRHLIAPSPTRCLRRDARILFAQVTRWQGRAAFHLHRRAHTRTRIYYFTFRFPFGFVLFFRPPRRTRAPRFDRAVLRRQLLLHTTAVFLQSS